MHVDATPPLIQEVIPEKQMKTLEETSQLFTEYAIKKGLDHAYRFFNVRQNRESLSIPNSIWKELEPSIREQISVIRTKLREKYAPKSEKSLTNTHQKSKQLQT